MKTNLRLWLHKEAIDQLKMLSIVTGRSEAELIELMIDKELNIKEEK